MQRRHWLSILRRSTCGPALNDFAAALRELNEAPICSLADLVAMKRATGRTSDELDLERLREALGELPGDRL